jgi:hypothetical protein
MGASALLGRHLLPAAVIIEHVLAMLGPMLLE